MVALVAEQTGYPPDLLDLDLDLEADLGIDTVKQAELFAQVRETYGIERDDTLKLRDYPTLNHVIGFVRDRTPTRHRDRADTTRRSRTSGVESVAAWPTPSSPDRGGGSGGSGGGAGRRADRLPARPARPRPRPRSRPRHRHRQAGRAVRPVRETYGIERDDSLKLRDYPTLNHVIGFVRDRTPHSHRRLPADPPTRDRRSRAPHRPRLPVDDAGFPRRVPVAGRAAAARLVRADRRAAGGRLASRRPARHRRRGRSVVGEARRSRASRCSAST